MLHMKTVLAMALLISAIAAPVIGQDLKADLMAIENKLWTAWGQKEAGPFQKYLTEDAVQIVAGTAPVAGRDAVVNVIKTLPCELRSFNLLDANLIRLTPDVVVLSYTATQDSSCEGKPLPAKVRATAVYVRQKGTWLQANYQETPFQ